MCSGKHACVLERECVCVADGGGTSPKQVTDIQMSSPVTLYLTF